MVKVRKQLPLNADGSLHIDDWLQSIKSHSPLVRAAVVLSQIAGEDVATFHGKSCFLQSLAVAEKIAELNLGEDAVVAALVYIPSEYADLSLDDIKAQLGAKIADLVKSVQQLHNISELQRANRSSSHKQIDTIRKMLLAMVRDVRVVVIKLAENLCMMRSTAHLNEENLRQLAHETMDIYAPLASRLGIHDIKWELEDIAFGILHPQTYKKIAKHLQERRVDREARVQMIISKIKQALSEAGIAGEVHGRAKHIYSIYRKMQRKNINFDEIYDAIAVRVLVPTEENCYTILSATHNIWEPIPEEFDDYISTPKSNGYQSIHTALIDQDGKHFEVQFRTFQMHEESEMGVAAHWMYKEGSSASGYEEKIKWLRQLLDWQKELTPDQKLPSALEKNIFEDRLYVFTPNGEIIDLPQGSTPLDFAYLIHTQVGHRCRGAKLKGKIVPLTTPLEMGDTVEIITGKESKPSRDWIVPQRGYLKTSRARAKVLHWFKTQDYDRHVEDGRDILERELKRLNLDSQNLEKLAHKFNYKHSDGLFAALGCGDIRLPQILGELQKSIQQKPAIITEAPTVRSTKQKKTESNDINIYGVGDLLTQIANCCKPVPGDPIIGYITQGHGVSIHHRDCKNAHHLCESHQNRIIEVEWELQTKHKYPVDLEVKSYDRPGLVSDVAKILSDNKNSILSMATTTDKKQQTAHIKLTIEISAINDLSKILNQISQLPNIIEVTRTKTESV